MNRLHQTSLKNPAIPAAEHPEKEIHQQPCQKTPRLIRHNPNADASHNTVALILAGGRGSRLQPLTQRRCKPAVPFGGGFRIIDFTLSNCINSGIRRIGVFTQYEQYSLIRHLQKGWNFLYRDYDEFIDVMPAQQRYSDNWYQGTADAIAQNQEFLKRLSPEFTLILAGDHIYMADYRRMIQQHVISDADVTIACCAIPLETAGQFGIAETNERGRIFRFQEKPDNPSGIKGRPGLAQASMGLYLFKTELLLECLAEDSRKPGSRHDFGADVIPALVTSHNVMAYAFEQAQTEDYWRDVGTIDAYYEANMQLLDPEPSIDLNNRDWPIHTYVSNAFPTHFAVDSLGHRGLATDCIVGSGCTLYGSQVRHSILFSDVQISEQSQVDNSLILPGAVIGKRCRIRNAIIDSHTRIEDGTEIGYDENSDAIHYRISEKGIVVVTPGDIGNVELMLRRAERKTFAETDTLLESSTSVQFTLSRSD